MDTGWPVLILKGSFPFIFIRVHLSIVSGGKN